MKRKVPGDYLESFLQNAFEGYAESPPDAVWEGIASDVKAAPVLRKAWYSSVYAWIGVAAAVLVGLVIYVAVHFNQKINNIENKVKEQQVDIQDLKEQKIFRSQPQAKLQNGNRTIKNERVHNERIKEERSDNKRVASSVSKSDHDNKVNAKALNNNRFNPKNIAPGESFTPDYQKSSVITSTGKMIQNADIANFTLKQPDPKKAIYPDSSVPTVGAPDVSPAVVNGNSSKQLTINLLNNITFSVLNKKATESIYIPAALPIKPVQQKAGFYVGVYALPMRQHSRITLVRPRSVPPLARQEVNQTDVIKSDALALGLSTGLGIAKNLALETGLMYQTSSSTNTHHTKFKYKDRRPPFPGGSMYDSRFEYDLNTPSGTVALAVTVENQTATEPIEEEEIALAITSEQQLSYLSIPLLLNYHIGKGKLHLNAKTGFLTHFLVGNKFKIIHINSNNINFRPYPNQASPGELLYVNELSLGYLLQFGLNYDVSPDVSVNISPTLTGSLSNSSSNWFIQATHTSAGVSAGVSWNF